MPHSTETLFDIVDILNFPGGARSSLSQCHYLIKALHLYPDFTNSPRCIAACLGICEKRDVLCQIHAISFSTTVLCTTLKTIYSESCSQAFCTAFMTESLVSKSWLQRIDASNEHRERIPPLCLQLQRV